MSAVNASQSPLFVQLKSQVGAIVVQLAPHNETNQTFSVENQLRMLTLGELKFGSGAIPFN